MKKILGSILFLTISLFAKSQYNWDVEVSKNTVYKNEAIRLSMKCTFDKDGKNDDVEFTPPTDDAFEFKLLGETRRVEGENHVLSYKYLVYLKKDGVHTLKLRPTMLFTTQSAIDNIIIGRDNVNDLEVDKEVAKINDIKINVLNTNSSLSGSFKISANIDKKEVSAYEPVHVEISIDGLGNMQDIKAINFNIDGVKVFSDEIEKQIAVNDKGYEGKWSQRFAFVSDKNFIIPHVEIKYFDTRLNMSKVLQTQVFHINIKKDGIKRESLIDKTDSPSDTIDFSAYLSFLYYILTFITGFIVAKLVHIPTRLKVFKKGEKIRQAKDAKELLEVLIKCDKNIFENEIKKLEDAVYKKENINLNKIKKESLAKM